MHSGALSMRSTDMRARQLEAFQALLIGALLRGHLRALAEHRGGDQRRLGAHGRGCRLRRRSCSAAPLQSRQRRVGRLAIGEPVCGVEHRFGRVSALCRSGDFGPFGVRLVRRPQLVFEPQCPHEHELLPYGLRRRGWSGNLRAGRRDPEPGERALHPYPTGILSGRRARAGVAVCWNNGALE